MSWWCPGGSWRRWRCSCFGCRLGRGGGWWRRRLLRLERLLTGSLGDLLRCRLRRESQFRDLLSLPDLKGMVYLISQRAKGELYEVLSK